MNCWLCENSTCCEVHDKELWNERRKNQMLSIFDVTNETANSTNLDEFSPDTPVQTRSPIPMATVSQLKYLKSLFAERKSIKEAMILRTHLLGEYKAGKLTRVMASEAIEDLIEMKLSVPQFDEGFYFDPRNNTIYKLQIAQYGSGNLYAKRLVLPENGEKKGNWVYEGRKPLQFPLEKLTLEKAKELGHLYGVCMKCGAFLTDERSIEAGIGPVCATKGW